uniref:C2H2-type domain-containing protein n=1 Tax=viral metagenome TaxID=1070528 RepID=A0A6C0BP62_9ZZZZ
MPPCDLCGQFFRNKYLLNYHLKERHWGDRYTYKPETPILNSYLLATLSPTVLDYLYYRPDDLMHSHWRENFLELVDQIKIASNHQAYSNYDSILCYPLQQLSQCAFFRGAYTLSFYSSDGWITGSAQGIHEHLWLHDLLKAIYTFQQDMCRTSSYSRQVSRQLRLNLDTWRTFVKPHFHQNNGHSKTTT